MYCVHVIARYRPKISSATFSHNREMLTINSQARIFQCTTFFFLFFTSKTFIDTFNREKSASDVTFSSTGLILDQRMPRHCSYRDLAVEMTNRSPECFRKMHRSMISREFRLWKISRMPHISRMMHRPQTRYIYHLWHRH